jgi:membrane protein implicated in regulation of membrane protease activity
MRRNILLFPLTLVISGVIAGIVAGLIGLLTGCLVLAIIIVIPFAVLSVFIVAMKFQRAVCSQKRK